MKRLTITITEEQKQRLCREAKRRGVSVSAVVRERIERAESEQPSPFEGLIGLADVKLPYSAGDIDAELARTWADEIAGDRGD